MTTPTPGPRRVHVWSAPLDVDARTRAVLAAALSDDELARARRFRALEHADRFVARRGWLRHLLAGYLDRPAASLVFGAGEHGKPHLAGEGTAWLRFSVSDSLDTALLAVSSDREVGVDIERRSDDIAVDGVARRVLGAAEQSALAAVPTDRRAGEFYTMWTCREAYLKALGLGLGHDHPPEQPDPRSWTVRSVGAGAGFAAAVAVEGHSVEVPSEATPLTAPV